MWVFEKLGDSLRKRIRGMGVSHGCGSHMCLRSDSSSWSEWDRNPRQWKPLDPFSKRAWGAAVLMPLHLSMSFCLVHKSHACHGESSKDEHNVWWLKESWNISNKKNSVYEADVVLSNKIERKKVKLMDVVQKLRKDTKMHLLLTPKQNKLQQRLSLVERGKACLKQLCWLILAQLKYQATFIDYYIN